MDAGLLPKLDTVFDLSAAAAGIEPSGVVLAGLFGYRSTPSPLEVVGYLAYLIPVLTLFILPAGFRIGGRAVATGAILVALIVGGCGRSTTTASGGPGASAAPGAIVVTATEFKFDPSTITATAGDVTFTVTNAGTVEHEFEIFKGDAVVDEVEGLVPGLTRELSVALDPGEYVYVCKLAGHDAVGMRGTLTVTAASG